MFGAVNLGASKPGTTAKSTHRYSFFGDDLLLRRRCYIRPPIRRLALPIVQSVQDFAAPTSETSKSSFSSRLVSSVGSATLRPSQWKLDQRHMLLLNVIACAAAVSATWLFLAAIPTLLAFKKAAESLEKLMDVTREELPDTMAAVRLSGMEISDLTMELSDLGQDITQGVKSSTRAVRLAEDKLRRLTNMAPASMQQNKTETGPAVARAARNLREVIAKGRAMWQIFFTILRVSKFSFNYFCKRANEKTQKR